MWRSSEGGQPTASASSCLGPPWPENIALMSAVKDPGERYRPPGGGALQMIAHRWGQDLKDVGEQALMRGLNTAVPILRLGQSLIMIAPV